MLDLNQSAVASLAVSFPFTKLVLPGERSKAELYPGLVFTFHFETEAHYIAQAVLEPTL